MVDDIEAPWLYRYKFSFIHARMMVGSLEDWSQFFRRCSEYVICPLLTFLC